MSKEQFFFTSESVTEGHPDKVADCISDAILDAIIEKDINCRVACETLVTTGIAFIAGEITTDCYVDMPQIVRNTIRDIGYNSSQMGFDWQTCAVITSIDHQSLDIAQGVNQGDGLFKEQGAGDQGLMFGFATDETDELMPMPIYFAHKLTKRLTTVRKNGALNFLRPDGKSQVTIEYENGAPKRVDTIVISAQHKPDVTYDDLKEAIIEDVIKKVIPKNMTDGDRAPVLCFCLHDMQNTGRIGPMSRKTPFSIRWASMKTGLSRASADGRNRLSLILYIQIPVTS